MIKTKEKETPQDPPRQRYPTRNIIPPGIMCEFEHDFVSTSKKEEPSNGDVIAEKVSEAFHEYTEGFVRTPQGRESFEKLLAEEMKKYDNRWRSSQEEKSPQEKIDTEIEKEGDVVVSKMPMPTYFEPPKGLHHPYEFTEGFVADPRGREIFLQKMREERERHELPLLQPFHHKDETQEKKKPEILFLD